MAADVQQTLAQSYIKVGKRQLGKMFTLTYERPKNWDTKGTYKGRYMFDLYRCYQLLQPYQIFEGIMLVMIVQWHVPGSKTNLVRKVCDQTFFIGKKNWQSDEELEDALKNIILPVLSSCFGIFSPEEQEPVTRHLVSLALSRYREVKDRNHLSRCIPLAMDILNQTEIDESHVFTWVSRELALLSMGFQKVKNMNASSSCCICLQELPVDYAAICMPCCPHSYHEYCIMEWYLKGHQDCPLCREPFFYQEIGWRYGSVRKIRYWLMMDAADLEVIKQRMLESRNSRIKRWIKALKVGSVDRNILLAVITAFGALLAWALRWLDLETHMTSIVAT